MNVRTMTASQCTTFLETHRLGHLAYSLHDQPYSVPIYCAVQNNYLYSFSLPGKKFDIMCENPGASLLVEEFVEGRAWKSALAQGRFEALPDRIGSNPEREHEWSLLSRHANWWEPAGPKPATQPLNEQSEHHFYGIEIEEISGREAAE